MRFYTVVYRNTGSTVNPFGVQPEAYGVREYLTTGSTAAAVLFEEDTLNRDCVPVVVVTGAAHNLYMVGA